MNCPLVSTIIPVHNGEKYLAQAIDSVLSQTYCPVEVIIVNDGSTDRTSAIAQKYGSAIHYHEQGKSGSGKARNAGIQLAQGNFFAFLDHDDLWGENKLQLQINALISTPELAGVFGQVQQFYSPELAGANDNKFYCPTQPVPGYIPSAFLIKREAFFEVGLFVENLQSRDWIDWYIRAFELGLRMLTLPDLVTYRRLHQTNQGITQFDEVRNDIIRVLKASLDRRRGKKSS